MRSHGGRTISWTASASVAGWTLPTRAAGIAPARCEPFVAMVGRRRGAQGLRLPSSAPAARGSGAITGGVRRAGGRPFVWGATGDRRQSLGRSTPPWKSREATRSCAPPVSVCEAPQYSACWLAEPEDLNRYPSFTAAHCARRLATARADVPTLGAVSERADARRRLRDRGRRAQAVTRRDDDAEAPAPVARADRVRLRAGARNVATALATTARQATLPLDVEGQGWGGEPRPCRGEGLLSHLEIAA